MLFTALFDEHAHLSWARLGCHSNFSLGDLTQGQSLLHLQLQFLFRYILVFIFVFF